MCNAKQLVFVSVIASTTMLTPTLQQIEEQVNTLAAKIDAPFDLLPTYGYTRDFAWPHIEVNHNGMHYVIVERGKEIERITTQDIDELLFRIFSVVTFTIAGKYELQHRVNTQDSRRILFTRQEELLGMLKPAWQQREQAAHTAILQRYPFDDYGVVRVEYWRQLRAQGYSEEEIKKLAYDKYPVMQ